MLNMSQPAAIATMEEGDETPNLTLTPRIHPLVARFLNNGSKVQELVGALGSPLNVLFPELVSHNLAGFQDTYSQHGIRGRVYFAHKANQSSSVIRQLAINSQGYVDVSSSNELAHALSSGLQGCRLEATGPKNLDFLSLAVLHGVTISVDTIAELQQVFALRKVIQSDKRTDVLLRLSGFESSHSRFLNKASRFGIPVSQLDEALSYLQQHRDILNFLGFSFHLDTVSVLERTIAVENCFELLEKALNLGLEPRVLNIGGGYKISYLANEEEWNHYTTALKEAILASGPPLTWHGNGFGMSADKGKLRGNFNSYSFYDELAGPQFLDELLKQQIPNRRDTTCSALLRDNMIELWIEPGRSLLDQAGITIAKVNSIRASSKGEAIVCLNMKRQDISFLDQEIFVDPVLLYLDGPSPSLAPVPVFFAGNLCLESDLIYRHKTFLPALPKPGDLVVFINTAGYFMDFSASQSIMQPVAEKIAVWERDDQFGWSMDRHYFPLGPLVT